MTLILGATSSDPRRIATWVAVVVVSVLIHELGHALMGKLFGLAPQIDLNGMGGVTSFSGGRDVSNGKSIAISLAGPLAGFAFATAIILAVRFAGSPSHPVAVDAIRQLKWVNIGWGIFNLLPLMPLDGGNVMRSALDFVTKGRGEKPARIVSIAVAIGLIVLAVVAREVWVGFLGLLFASQNVQAIRHVQRAKVDAPLLEIIRAADVALERQDGARAIALLSTQSLHLASGELRQLASRQLAYAYLLENRWSDLVTLIERERDLIGAEEVEKFARTARELGHEEEARRIEAHAPPAPGALTDFKSS